MRTVHILSGDLTLHKRTLEPIKTLVYGLRRYDVDRCAALLDSAQAKAAVEGFMSHKSKIYLVSVDVQVRQTVPYPVMIIRQTCTTTLTTS